MKKNILFYFLLFTIGASDLWADDRLKLPKNFYYEIYADNISSARSMSFDEKGNLYVGSRKSGNIYVITKNRKKYTIDRGLQLPVGLDYYRGDLYVSSVSKILVYRNINRDFRNPVKPEILYSGFPKDTWHGWKFIKIGPDRKLYVPVGAPCNVCLKRDKRYSTIMRMDLDGKNVEIYSHGVRNSVGFDWHPVTGELWFTENGRDWMGDDTPPDELNRGYGKGNHFGFPFKHGKDVRDPRFWKLRKRRKFIDPVYEFQAHVAALGMRFYTGKMFPSFYRGGIFVAEHGSWNRSSKVGYRVSFLKINGNRIKSYSIFASGFLRNGRVNGRPADVEIGPEGALYVSDDYSDRIYRIYYKKTD